MEKQDCSFATDGGTEESVSALLLTLSFTGEGESLQTDEGACPSFLLAYIISPLGVDEEEEEEEGGGEREKGKSD